MNDKYHVAASFVTDKNSGYVRIIFSSDIINSQPETEKWVEEIETYIKEYGGCKSVVVLSWQKLKDE